MSHSISDFTAGAASGEINFGSISRAANEEPCFVTAIANFSRFSFPSSVSAPARVSTKSAAPTSSGRVRKRPKRT